MLILLFGLNVDWSMVGDILTL